MTVRRLAPAEVQPASFAFSNDNKAWADAQIAKYPPGRQASAVIPLLWQAQKQAGGWVPQKAIEHVADTLGMAYIRVLEVATFYTMFNLAPVGTHFIQLCGTTPCALRGAEKLKDTLRERIGEQGHVTYDGKFSWLEVECLGACCNAPMVQINDDFYEDLTPESLNRLMDDLSAGKSVRIGPQNGRRSSEPEGAVKTLLDSSLYDGSAVGSWRKAFDERIAKAQAAKAEAAKAAEATKSAGAQAAPVPAAPTPPPVPPAPAPAAQEPSASQTDAPAQLSLELAAEEKDMAAKLAALPKDASPEQKANAVGERPQGLEAARGGNADDLKKISGIGKVNEGKLNALGIFHFDQIAAWDRAQIRWVGTYLSFSGRIDRENWVAQAKQLATGGETAFSKRVERGEVPTSKS